MIAILTTLFGGLWSRIWPYLLMAGAVLAALLMLYEKGKSAGRAAIEAKQKDATLRAQKRTIDEIRTANDARDSVRSLPRERLRDRDKFSRD